MIQSMTAFGSANAEAATATLSVELRSVNSRFLDLHFRMPDELRQIEAPLREQIGKALQRGKVEIRVAYARRSTQRHSVLDPDFLAQAAEQQQQARRYFPGLREPGLNDLYALQNLLHAPAAPDEQDWPAAALAAAADALAQLSQNRQREGERLRAVMQQNAAAIRTIVGQVEAAMPGILANYRQRLSDKLRETLESAAPGGFAQITGAELSERLAQETTLFSLRVDVAEELARLNTHLAELEDMLAGRQDSTNKRGSLGKRLDFLFQEMNREANTLGSKAGDISVTRAAMDLKLLIEQLREQAANLE
ncbi:YicC/YloC family endoribonuclease [Kerstersia sp.]|uniref:YicC/YloC family endoribonuclease n=1 Tax=Kerstersia sp. TaxID=1930783 RepID=UPI003F8E9E7E